LMMAGIAPGGSPAASGPAAEKIREAQRGETP
jgi:hypothetical protein